MDAKYGPGNYNKKGPGKGKDGEFNKLKKWVENDLEDPPPPPNAQGGQGGGG
jgi:hypothetical protein